MFLIQLLFGFESSFDPVNPQNEINCTQVFISQVEIDNLIQNESIASFKTACHGPEFFFVWNEPYSDLGVCCFNPRPNDTL